MGHHADSAAGRSDDWTSCDGEDRADPDSWNDPAIRDAWEPPPIIDEVD